MLYACCAFAFMHKQHTLTTHGIFLPSLRQSPSFSPHCTATPSPRLHLHNHGSTSASSLEVQKTQKLG